MLRRAPLCFALSMLLFAPACKKQTDDAEAGDETDQVDAKAADASKTEAPAKADPTPDPVTPPATDEGGAAGSGGGSGANAGSGGGGGSGAGGSGGAPAAPREDLTCDPLEDGACLEGEQCIGAQGCGAVWTCDATITCKKGVREYCGCDGRTFEAVYGNCPWKKYEYPGPCK